MSESLETKIEVALEQLRRLREDIKDLDDKISKNYITKVEFEPIKRVVYGIVSLILVSVAGAVMALVIKS